MNASRITSLTLALLLLSGCGTGGTQLAPEQRTELYRTAIENATHPSSRLDRPAAALPPDDVDTQLLGKCGVDFRFNVLVEAH